MKQISKDEIIAHPANSFWLKDAIQKLDDRDPVDALRDVRTLQIYLEQKLHRIQQG